MSDKSLKDIWDSLPEIEKKMCTLVIGQHIPFELYEVYTDLNNRIKKLEEVINEQKPNS